MPPYATHLWQIDETWFKGGLVNRCDWEIAVALGKDDFLATFGEKPIRKLTRLGSPIA